MPAKKRVVRQKAKGPIDPAFGQRLREIRIERGMSQKELAGSDFTKGFISLLETGRTRSSLRAANILASRLGVAVADLMGPQPVLAYTAHPLLTSSANEALGRLAELEGLAVLVRPAKRLVEKVLLIEAGNRRKIERIKEHLEGMPNPMEFSPARWVDFTQVFIRWREDMWRIYNEAPEKEGKGL